MQDYLGHRHDEPPASLGHRRSGSELVRIATDLTWARADSLRAARLGSYPSPPMSGSPPLPPKASQEAAERIQGTTYQAAAQDVYRGNLGASGEERAQTAIPGPSGPPHAGASGLPFAFQRLEGPMTRPPLLYPPQGAAGGLPHPQPASYAPSHRTALTPPLPTPQPYLAPPQQQPGQERPSSPKPQRKTKGHVASACVPCKKAHLRFVHLQPASPTATEVRNADLLLDATVRTTARPALS